jgi:hypothetical protein
MKSVKVQLVRDGSSQGVLEKKRAYIFIGPSGVAEQFLMPIGHEDCLKLLHSLRYGPQDGGEPSPQLALNRLAGTVTQILDSASLPFDESPLHLDLVVPFQELWVLPFEAASTATGQRLFAQPDRPIVLTRRVPVEGAERQGLRWPARPRVLFIHASPKWLTAPPVPSKDHRDALLAALGPWFDELGDPRTVLTELKDASLEVIREVCEQAVRDKRPYNLVHILAHGVEIPAGAAGIRYGIALCSPDNKPTDSPALVEALRPPARANAPYDVPAVVSLACCDSANASASFLSVGGLAQELHRAGVPIVVASQLPLTFSGATTFTRVFYENWAKGTDVRHALHRTRVALAENEDAHHDWMSLVAYVRLPEEYNNYLLETRLQSQLAALEASSNMAKTLLEKETEDAWQYEAVAANLNQRIAVLDGFLKELEAETGRSRTEVFQENTGLLGSAHKRLAELYDAMSGLNAANREDLQYKSRAALEKACNVYRAGFLHRTSHHWSGVQYLAIQAVLTGSIADPDHWTTCKVAAISDRDGASRVQDRIWALGSLTELALLAPLSDNIRAGPGTAEEALDQLVQGTRENKGLFPDPDPIVSTRRQLERYVKWWTRKNGFFPGGVSDLSEPAGKFLERLK